MHLLQFFSGNSLDCVDSWNDSHREWIGRVVPKYRHGGVLWLIQGCRVGSKGTIITILLPPGICERKWNLDHSHPWSSFPSPCLFLSALNYLVLILWFGERHMEVLQVTGAEWHLEKYSDQSIVIQLKSGRARIKAKLSFQQEVDL